VSLALIVSIILTIVALTQRQQAIAQKNLADQRRAEAERATQVALSRQLAAQSELLRNQHPTFLPRTVLLAAEAMQRFSSIDTYVFLRAGVSLLPRRLAQMEHDGDVRCVAMAIDSRRLTNGERVWDAVTGQEVSRFQFQPDENDQVRAVAFSQDDKFVVTGTGGQFAFLWDAATGQRLKTFRQKRQKSYAALEDVFRHDFSMTVSFSPDGKYLATAGGDIQARVWEVEGQKEVATLPHQNMVRWAAFTGNGQQVLTAGDDGTVRLWEALSGHELTRITHDEEAEQYSEASSNSSGKYIVVGAGRRVSLWESATGRVSRRLVHKTAVADVTFSHDGKLLATCDTTTARVWDVASSALIAPPMIQQEANIGSSLRDKLKSVDFSADGKLLATANGDQTARIWDVTSGNEIVRLPLKGMVDMASFGADGKVFVTTNSGNGPEENIDLWDGPD